MRTKRKFGLKQQPKKKKKKSQVFKNFQKYGQLLDT